MKSPLLLLLSLVIPNCRVPEKGGRAMVMTLPATDLPVKTHPIKDRPLPVDGIVELY